MGWLLSVWLFVGLWLGGEAAAVTATLLPLALASTLGGALALGVLAGAYTVSVERGLRRLPRAEILGPRLAHGQIRWGIDPPALDAAVARRRLDRPALLIGIPLAAAMAAAMVRLLGFGDPPRLAFGVFSALAAAFLVERRLRSGRRLWRAAARRVAAAYAHPLPPEFETEQAALLHEIAALRTRLYGAPLLNGIIEGARARLLDGVHEARAEVLTDPACLAIVCRHALDDLRDYADSLKGELAWRSQRRQPGGAPDADRPPAEEAEPSENDYTLLGVEPVASDSELRRAFLRLALKLHPDRDPGLPAGPFAAVNGAYRRIRAQRARRRSRRAHARADSA